MSNRQFYIDASVRMALPYYRMKMYWVESNSCPPKWFIDMVCNNFRAFVNQGFVE